MRTILAALVLAPAAALAGGMEVPARQFPDGTYNVLRVYDDKGDCAVGMRAEFILSSSQSLPERYRGKVIAGCWLEYKGYVVVFFEDGDCYMIQPRFFSPAGTYNTGVWDKTV